MGERDILTKRLEERRAQLAQARRDVEVLPLVIADLEAALLGVSPDRDRGVCGAPAPRPKPDEEAIRSLIVAAGQAGLAVREITEKLRQRGMSVSEVFVSNRLRRSSERLGLESFGPSRRQTRWRARERAGSEA